MDNLQQLVSDVEKAPEGAERIGALQRLEKAARGAIRGEADKGEKRLPPVEAVGHAQHLGSLFDGGFSFRHLDNGEALVSYGAHVLCRVPALGLAQLTAVRLRRLVVEANAASRMKGELTRIMEMLDNLGEVGHIGSIEEGWLLDIHGNNVEEVDSFLEEARKLTGGKLE